MLQEKLFLAAEGDAQMLIRGAGDTASPGRAGEKALLHEIGFVHVSMVTGSSLMVAEMVSNPTGPPA